MRALYLFMMISVDGYFEGPGHDLSWHNANNDEFQQFAIEQTSTVGTILFGRRTYDMMAEFWTSAEARETDPDTTKLMNEKPKVIFSHSLKEVPWQNSRLAERPLADEVRALKQEPGEDIAIFGSNNIATQLMEAKLLDELRIMVNPIALGNGTSLFGGLYAPQRLSLNDTRTFKNGNILLRYKVNY